MTSYVCRYDSSKETELTLEDGAYVLTTNMGERTREWFRNRLADQLVDGEFSARQTDFIKDQNAGFKRVFADELEYKCGVSLDWEIDWASFEEEMDKRIEKEQRSSIYDVCGVPVNRLVDVCAGNEKVKRKVKKKLKAFRCKFGGKRKRKLSLRKGTLTYRVDFGAKDAYGYVDKFLVKKRIIKKRPPPKKLSPADLAKIRRILGDKGTPLQQCRRACSKQCRGAQNKSKCKVRCRARCR